ncbi:MAG: succinate dehydrogenase cytochrome b subunit [Saprospiraceae bacterium]|nr:succinate dehydrogenase cytochrome b subunit [Saprospiraceae bacterium]MBP7699632.1 succinate dehydrogenase cytochrome b subunit [Saprospiraceae bacterium]
MNWFSKFFTSSIGQKVIMSLTGLFLILFLVVHLAGNLQLLKDDNGEAFNIYSKFMTSNPLIKFISYGLYFFILLHAIQGMILWKNNRAAKGGKYAVQSKESTWSSRNMGMLGVLLFVFLGIHMGDFWWAMKRHQLPLVSYEGYPDIQDLYFKVNESFKELWIVIVYIISMVALYFHLSHGFASAFQTLGINHRKYTPIIKAIGWGYAILIPAAFAIIPIYYYFFK